MARSRSTLQSLTKIIRYQKRLDSLKQIRPLRMAIGCIKPNEPKRLILYGSTQPTNPARRICEKKYHTPDSKTCSLARKHFSIVHQSMLNRRPTSYPVCIHDCQLKTGSHVDNVYSPRDTEDRTSLTLRDTDLRPRAFTVANWSAIISPLWLGNLHRTWSG